MRVGSSNKRNDEQKERLRSVYKGGMGKSFTRYLVFNRDVRESEAVCSLCGSISSFRFAFFDLKNE